MTDTRSDLAGDGGTGVTKILLVEDDPVAARLVVAALEQVETHLVSHVTDPREALALVDGQDWDVVITDLGLPHVNGLDVIRGVRACRPGIGVIVISGAAEVTDAVEALRLQADDFLLKPVVPDLLLARVAAVAAAQRSRRRREMVLAIGAHPDDIEIGVGGTLLSHRDGGDGVAILIMSGGERGGLKRGRAAEAEGAAKLLGAELFIERLEDTHIPESGQSIAIIEDVIARVGATCVYTHSAHDRHQDHRNTHRAAMIATRSIPRVYCYQSPSCTIDYHPARFVAIDQFLEGKLRLIRCHRSQAESRKYLEEDLIVSIARYWGWFGGSRYAEPFEVTREVHGIEEPRRADAAEDSTPSIGQVPSSRAS